MDCYKIALIGAGSRWGVYSKWIKDSDQIELVAIAEADSKRLEHHKQEQNISDEACFSSWEPMLKYIKDKNVDSVIICTSDHDHYKPAMACLEENYHLILEKPIAPTPKECLDIAQLANKKDRVVMVSHVLRYTPFFSKIKEIIEKGEIGSIQAIQHTENVGYFHMAHSFVRGIWNCKAKSNPIIVSKSCHDLDMLLYIMPESSSFAKVAGFGNIKHFTSANAPQGATERCSKQCPVYETCPYSIKTYFTSGAFVKSIFGREPEKDELEKALETNRYGRCVYHCDNDVCDSMSTIIEFNSGATATFTLSAFTDEIDRTINIMGSHGQIRATMENDEIIVHHFGKGEGIYRNKEKVVYNPIKEQASSTEEMKGHGGGDELFIQDFVNVLKGKGNQLTSISQSIESHLAGFAIEESRLSQKIINMEDYIKSFKI